MHPGGLVAKNPVNNTSGRHIHNYSTFDRSLSYRLYNTLRFGDYTPSFEMEGVESDEINLNSLDRIDSLSLNAPFKGSIRKIKESFKVPNMAILPLQWDRIYAQNSNGDDVPDDANCVISDWLSCCKELWSHCYDITRNQLVVWSTDTSGANSASINTFFTALLRTLVLGEYMFSSGSLLHVSGYKYGSQFWQFPVQAVVDPSIPSYRTDDYWSYDKWFDFVCRTFFQHVRDIWVSVPNGYRKFSGLDADYAAPSWYESFRSLLEAFRENPLLNVTQVYIDDRFDTLTTGYADFATELSGYIDGEYPFYKASSGYVWNVLSVSVSSDDPTLENPGVLNLSRLLAYQLVCAHFFTNSSIDFVYSAELYREYVYSLYRSRGFVNLNNAEVFNAFPWNGKVLPYDYLSGHVLKQLLFGAGNSRYMQFIEGFNANIAILGGDPTSGNNIQSTGVFAAFAAVFGFRKSLRYGDYFTASRPRPLAPINTDVSVNNSQVSVIDITRNIQAQRFANSVMRTRSKIEDYVKGLFGKAPAPDFHNPFFLVRQEETIFGDEVQNTAESQVNNPNSRTANFVGNVSPHTFTFHNDDMHPCIYLQIISFDIRRAYTRSVDRQFLHVTRFDMFNPDFQYIGDQPIFGIELGYPVNGVVPDVFSYTTRDMEYKQRFDQASSGFVENLPGWILTDRDRSKVTTPNLDPDFIRSYNTELDQFFLSLTGYSLGSYFHFVCITDNNVSAKRAMAVDPQILA